MIGVVSVNRHKIWGDPAHELEAVHFQLYLPTKFNERTTTVVATGTSRTSRPSMWVLREEWSASEIEHGYQASDALSHVALVALQDHPTSQAQMEACMVGEGWAQPGLWD